MPRKFYYIGMEIEISDYQDIHRYRNQILIEGIPFNPLQREDFDQTPKAARDLLEIVEWWDEPYVKTCSWDDCDESWESYIERAKSWSSGEPESHDEFLERMRSRKENWFKAWPSGTRYEVRCLNGGAWDRSTGLAMVATLEEAIAVAKQYKDAGNVQHGF